MNRRLRGGSQYRVQASQGFAPQSRGGDKTREAKSNNVKSEDVGFQHRHGKSRHFHISRMVARKT